MVPMVTLSQAPKPIGTAPFETFLAHWVIQNSPIGSFSPRNKVGLIFHWVKNGPLGH